MLPRPPVEQPRELDLVPRLLLMDHDAEDVPPDRGLHRLETEVRGEGAVLVDRLPSDHTEREHELAPAVEQDPGARGEIIDTGNGVPVDRKPPALSPRL